MPFLSFGSVPQRSPFWRLQWANDTKTNDGKRPVPSTAPATFTSHVDPETLKHLTIGNVSKGKEPNAPQKPTRVPPLKPSATKHRTTSHVARVGPLVSLATTAIPHVEPEPSRVPLVTARGPLPDPSAFLPMQSSSSTLQRPVLKYRTSELIHVWQDPLIGPRRVSKHIPPMSPPLSARQQSSMSDQVDPRSTDLHAPLKPPPLLKPVPSSAFDPASSGASAPPPSQRRHPQGQLVGQLNLEDGVRRSKAQQQELSPAVLAAVKWVSQKQCWVCDACGIRSFVPTTSAEAFSSRTCPSARCPWPAPLWSRAWTIDAIDQLLVRAAMEDHCSTELQILRRYDHSAHRKPLLRVVTSVVAATEGPAAAAPDAFHALWCTVAPAEYTEAAAHSIVREQKLLKTRLIPIAADTSHGVESAPPLAASAEPSGLMPAADTTGTEPLKTQASVATPLASLDVGTAAPTAADLSKKQVKSDSRKIMRRSGLRARPPDVFYLADFNSLTSLDFVLSLRRFRDRQGTGNLATTSFWASPLCLSWHSLTAEQTRNLRKKGGAAGDVVTTAADSSLHDVLKSHFGESSGGVLVSLFLSSTVLILVDDKLNIFRSASSMFLLEMALALERNIIFDWSCVRDLSSADLDIQAGGRVAVLAPPMIRSYVAEQLRVKVIEEGDVSRAARLLRNEDWVPSVSEAVRAATSGCDKVLRLIMENLSAENRKQNESALSVALHDSAVEGHGAAVDVLLDFHVAIPPQTFGVVHPRAILPFFRHQCPLNFYLISHAPQLSRCLRAFMQGTTEPYDPQNDYKPDVDFLGHASAAYTMKLSHGEGIFSPTMVPLDLSSRAGRVHDLSAHAILAIAKVLKRVPFSKLILDDNLFGDAGVQSICDYLPLWSHMSNLSLANVSLGARGIQSLVNVLQDSLVKTLSLAKNHLSIYVEPLIHSLHLLPLTSLDLSGNPLGAVGGDLLRKFLPKARKLRTLKLAHTQLSTVGAESLLQCIHHTTITYLDISHNSIGDTAITTFCDVLYPFNAQFITGARLISKYSEDIVTVSKAASACSVAPAVSPESEKLPGLIVPSTRSALLQSVQAASLDGDDQHTFVPTSTSNVGSHSPVSEKEKSVGQSDSKRVIAEVEAEDTPRPLGSTVTVPFPLSTLDLSNNLLGTMAALAIIRTPVLAAALCRGDLLLDGNVELQAAGMVRPIVDLLLNRTDECCVSNCDLGDAVAVPEALRMIGAPVKLINAANNALSEYTIEDLSTAVSPEVEYLDLSGVPLGGAGEYLRVLLSNVPALTVLRITDTTIPNNDSFWQVLSSLALAELNLCGTLLGDEVFSNLFTLWNTSLASKNTCNGHLTRSPTSCALNPNSPTDAIRRFPTRLGQQSFYLNRVASYPLSSPRTKSPHLSISTLKVDRCQLTISFLHSLAAASSSMRHLTTLSVSGNNFNHVSAAQSLRSILQNTCLRNLNINNCGFTDAVALAVVQGLCGTSVMNLSIANLDTTDDVLGIFEELLPQLHSVDLSSCSLSTSESGILAAALEKSPNLEHINLSGNWFDCSGVKSLAVALPSTRIRDLDLSSNWCKNVGLKALCSALLQPQCKMVKLNMQANRFTSSGIDSFASALATRGAHCIKVLHLGCESVITASAMAALCTISSLTELYLATCKIESESMEALATSELFLRLDVLNIEQCGITDAVLSILSGQLNSLVARAAQAREQQLFEQRLALAKATEARIPAATLGSVLGTAEPSPAPATLEINEEEEFGAAPVTISGVRVYADRNLCRAHTIDLLRDILQHAGGRLETPVVLTSLRRGDDSVSEQLRNLASAVDGVTMSADEQNIMRARLERLVAGGGEVTVEAMLQAVGAEM